MRNKVCYKFILKRSPYKSKRNNKKSIYKSLTFKAINTIPRNLVIHNVVRFTKELSHTGYKYSER